MKIIIYSAFTTYKDKETAIEIGADGFLEKPVEW